MRTFIRLTPAFLLGLLCHFLQADGLAAPANRAETTASSTCNDGWLDGPPVNGVGGPVTAIARDGAGNVYVSGHFRSAGDKIVNYIAKWDGSTWSPMGAGLATGAGAIVIVGTDVYASARYMTPGGGVSDSPVSRWDGSMWSPAGSGGLQGSVADLAVSGSTIYAAGLRNRGGDDWQTSVSAWNGTNWAPVGPEIGFQRISGSRLVLSLAVSGTDIYLGGNFPRAGGVDQIVKWNGTAWTSLGKPFTGEFSDLAVSGTDLYAAGEDQMGTIGSVVKWNGTAWSALGQSGITKPERYPWIDIYAIEASGTNVYIAGRFSQVDGVRARGTAKWDGSRWSANGSWSTGTESYTRSGQWMGNDAITAVAITGNDIYFGGTFVTSNGVLRADGIAKWNGSEWSALGLGRYEAPVAFATSGSDIYAAGYFSNDGGSTVSRVGKWTGNGWATLPAWDSPSPDGITFVEAIAVSGVNIYVGGGWQHPLTGVHRGFVQHWNGSKWSELGTGMTGSAQARVYTLALLGNDVYAGGDFTSAGGTPAGMIARWQGGQWSALDSGRAYPVLAMAVLDNDLYVGGSLDCYFCDVVHSRVLKWNGSQWSTVGDGQLVSSGRPGSPDVGYRAVAAIAVSGSNIYAIGAFDRDDYSDVGFISRWNGSQWHDSLFDGEHFNTLAVSGDEMFLTGNGLYKWNGSSLSRTEFVGNVTNMAVANGQLFVASGFNYVAGCHVSAHYARYSLGLPGSVSGRVLTPTGAPIRNATVRLNDDRGVVQTAATSSFGNYRFEGIPAGQNYTLTVSSRRYRFTPRALIVDGPLTGVDLTGLE